MVAFENREAEYGTGVFACQRVAKGEEVWRFDEENCIRLVKTEKIKLNVVFHVKILTTMDSWGLHRTVK